MSKTKKFSKVLALVIMLALVIGVMPMAASATTTGWVSVAEGEMIAIDWTLTGTNTYTGTVVDAYTLSSTTYTMPHSFVLWAHSTPTAPTYTCGTGITVTYLYDSYTDETMTDMSKAYRVDVSGIDENDTSDLTFITADGTYTVTLPAATPGAAGGTFPSYVNGYLLVGQYAAGASWGGIFSDGINRTGETTKFTVNGSGSVSLGACGGYIQFEFENPIQNNMGNLYGVDFIVYGNAFSTNAEAGSVQVSNDGTTWYELAGSRYYNLETLRNVNVSYKLAADGNNGNRVFYKIWDNSGTNGAEVVYKNWTLLKPGANTNGWWPIYDSTSENYGVVSGIGTALEGTAAVNKAAWNSNHDMITFYGITLVKDEDNASEYTFGYADVHGNGTYGVASNPYAAGQNTGGGDGFDISWAVDTDGTPVVLTEVKYVRVYTSAGIKYTNDVPYIFVHDAFNETSTEVCGLYVASGEGEDSMITPTSIKVGNSTFSFGACENIYEAEDEDGNVYLLECGSLSGKLIEVTGTSSAHVFINGNAGATFTALNNNPVQIIIQNGDAEPLIIYIT